jgi:signal transduction histidine kinase
MNPAVRAYAGAIAAVGAAAIVTFFVRRWIEPSISILFFPAIILSAIYGGFGPALLATLVSTAALAFLFVPPRYSLNIGADDAIRLLVFAVVSYATSFISSARRLAEQAQRESLRSLQAALDVMRNISAWPLLIDSDTASSMRRILAHGANAIGAATALAVWEAEEEPWIYVTSARSQEDPTSRHAPSLFAPLRGEGLTAEPAVYDNRDMVSVPGPIRQLLPAGPVASVPFHTEYLVGRVFFGGLPVQTADLMPALTVVAREIGNSLAHLYVAEQTRALAIREDRLRVSRDLHDGVLQGLTGIRLEIQNIAAGSVAIPATHERLLAAERALAIEQRQLRLFIDTLRPDGQASPAGTLAADLEATAARLSMEWNTPITVRVALKDRPVPTAIEHEIRMMAHEAIVNALKHGHPSRVTIAVDAGDGRLTLTVTDDGRGFPFQGEMDHDSLTRNHAGPVSLRERVMALGGRIAVRSAPTGARVELTLPI